MRAADANILIIPGYLDSGPDHWQSRWEKKLSTARRVVQRDFARPDRVEWVETIRKSGARHINGPGGVFPFVHVADLADLIEVAAVADACWRAWMVTGDRRWLEEIARRRQRVAADRTVSSERATGHAVIARTAVSARRHHPQRPNVRPQPRCRCIPRRRHLGLFMPDDRAYRSDAGRHARCGS